MFPFLILLSPNFLGSYIPTFLLNAGPWEYLKFSSFPKSITLLWWGNTNFPQSNIFRHFKLLVFIYVAQFLHKPHHQDLGVEGKRGAGLMVETSKCLKEQLWRNEGGGFKQSSHRKSFSALGCLGASSRSTKLRPHEVMVPGSANSSVRCCVFSVFK